MKRHEPKINKEKAHQHPSSISIEQKILNARHVIGRANLVMHNLLLSIIYGKDIEMGDLFELVRKIYKELKINDEAFLYCARQKKRGSIRQ